MRMADARWIFLAVVLIVFSFISISPFIESAYSQGVPRPNRHRLLPQQNSWTRDEEFGMVGEAARIVMAGPETASACRQIRPHPRCAT